MKITMHINEGLHNLLSSKLRSVLALLGILVGTASVVAMVSGGELATNEALKQFKTLGTDLLSVSISEEGGHKASSTASLRSLTVLQADNIIDSDPAIQEVAPYTKLYQPVYYGGKTIDGIVLGVTGKFFDVVHIKIERGRFISSLDSFSLFCVIGNRVYEEIKKNTFHDPIGSQIQIGKNIFTIVGIAKPWPENSFVYANIDFAILIPTVTSLAINNYVTISDIIFRLTPNTDIEQIKGQITRYINGFLGHKNLYFRSAKELIMRMAKQNEILTIFLGLIGGISLLVGGIGVMNIMLVSVIERKREIGIRMAVGAKRKDIQSLFLTEAVILALVGGVAGVVIGMLIAYVISLVFHWQFFLLWLPPVIGFTISTATGIFFGYYPAYKASQLDPIEALKSE